MKKIGQQIHDVNTYDLIIVKIYFINKIIPRKKL